MTMDSSNFKQDKTYGQSGPGYGRGPQSGSTQSSTPTRLEQGRLNALLQALNTSFHLSIHAVGKDADFLNELLSDSDTTPKAIPVPVRHTTQTQKRFATPPSIPTRL